MIMFSQLDQITKVIYKVK